MVPQGLGLVFEASGLAVTALGELSPLWPHPGLAFQRFPALTVMPQAFVPAMPYDGTPLSWASLLCLGTSSTGIS